MRKPTGRRPSLKERRFVDAYLGSCSGNATAAAIEAGYSPKTAQPQSSRLLSRVMVRAAVDGRVAKESTASIATAAERDERLSQIMRRTDVDLGLVIAAIRELNKCSGRHSLKHVLDATESLADIIAGSRASA